MKEKSNSKKFSTSQKTILQRINFQNFRFDGDETVLSAKISYETAYVAYLIYFIIFIFVLAPFYLYFHWSELQHVVIYDILLSLVILFGIIPARKLENIMTSIQLCVFTKKATYNYSLSRKSESPQKLLHKDLDYCNCYVKRRRLNKTKFKYQIVFGSKAKKKCIDCKTRSEFLFYKNLLQNLYLNNALLFQTTPEALMKYPHLNKYSEQMNFNPIKVKSKKATRMKIYSPFFFFISLFGGLFGGYKLGSYLWNLIQLDSGYIAFLVLFPLVLFILFCIIMIFLDNWRVATNYLNTSRDARIELHNDHIKRILQKDGSNFAYEIPFKENLTYETFEIQPHQSMSISNRAHKSYRLSFFEPLFYIENFVELDDIDDFQYGFQWKYYHWLKDQNFFLDDCEINSTFKSLTPNEFNEILLHKLVNTKEEYFKRNQSCITKIQQAQNLEHAHENLYRNQTLYSLNEYRQNLEGADEIQNIFRSDLSFREYLDKSKVKRVGIIIVLLIIASCIFILAYQQGFLDLIVNLYPFLFVSFLIIGSSWIIGPIGLFLYILLTSNISLLKYLEQKKIEYVLAKKAILIHQTYDLIVVPFEKIDRIVYSKPKEYYIPKIEIFFKENLTSVMEKNSYAKTSLFSISLRSPLLLTLVEIGMELE